MRWKLSRPGRVARRHRPISNQRRRRSAQVRQASRLRSDRHAPRAIREPYGRRGAILAKRDRFLDEIPTTMVMEDIADSEEHLRARPRRVQQAGWSVCSRQPLRASCRGLTMSLGTGCGVARWLVSPHNPFTARVA